MASDDARRCSSNRHIIRNIGNDRRACPDNGPFADADAWNDAYADPKEGILPTGDGARQVNARREIDAILKQVVVIDGCACVDDAEAADTSIRSNDRSGGEHASFAH